eukprot:TRINITY_DN75039_c0_g1_i1.p1 TRINITY_DN75039_c0_g1~~TRINITY_DN75039_c0_g1_i1.p1  ORF type:complete len:602 (-),score=101.95 TRINITY_DN75039_c0_g1_i1:271-2076(-)
MSVCSSSTKCAGVTARAAPSTPQPLRRGVVASSFPDQPPLVQATSQTISYAQMAPSTDTYMQAASPKLSQSQMASPLGSGRFCFTDRTSQQRSSAGSSATRTHSVESNCMQSGCIDTSSARNARAPFAVAACVGSADAGDVTLQHAQELREQRLGAATVRRARSPSLATASGRLGSPSQMLTARPGSRQGSVRRHSVHQNGTSVSCGQKSAVSTSDSVRVCRGDDEDTRTEKLCVAIPATCSSPVMATPVPRNRKPSSSASLGGGGTRPHSVGSAYVPCSSAALLSVPLSVAPLCGGGSSVVAEVVVPKQFDIETESDFSPSVAKSAVTPGGKHDTKRMLRQSVHQEELLEKCRQLEAQLTEQVKKTKDVKAELKAERTTHAATQGRLAETKQRLSKHDVELPQMEARVLEQESRLVDRLAVLRSREEQLARDEEAMQARERDLVSKEQDKLRREGELVAAERQLAERERRLADREERLANREGKVAEQASELRLEREQAMEELDRLTAELKRDRESLQTLQDQLVARQKQLDEREQHHIEASREALVLKSRPLRCSGKENFDLERQRDDQQRLMKMIKLQGWQQDSKTTEEVLASSANSP